MSRSALKSLRFSWVITSGLKHIVAEKTLLVRVGATVHSCVSRRMVLIGSAVMWWLDIWWHWDNHYNPRYLEEQLASSFPFLVSSVKAASEVPGSKESLSPLLSILYYFIYLWFQDVPFEVTLRNVACLEALFDPSRGHIGQTTEAFYTWLSSLMEN